MTKSHRTCFIQHRTHSSHKVVSFSYHGSCFSQLRICPITIECILFTTEHDPMTKIYFYNKISMLKDHVGSPQKNEITKVGIWTCGPRKWIMTPSLVSKTQWSWTPTQMSVTLLFGSLILPSDTRKVRDTRTSIALPLWYRKSKWVIYLHRFVSLYQSVKQQCNAHTSVMSLIDLFLCTSQLNCNAMHIHLSWF